MFLDYQVIAAEGEDDVTYMFRKLVEEYEKWGLEQNLKNTKYMVIGEHKQDMNTHKETIKFTDRIKYLGVTLTADKRDGIDSQSRIRKIRVLIMYLYRTETFRKLQKNKC